MPFEKIYTTEYMDLDPNTKYRFAELELVKAQSILYKLNGHSRGKAENMLFNLLAPPLLQRPELEESFTRALHSNLFRQPRKAELVHYLLVCGLSYASIRELTGVSPNTISKYKHGIPQYFPVWDGWEPEMLAEWNNVKHFLNLFNEPVAHSNNV